MTHREIAVGQRACSGNHVEVPHHPGRVVLEDVAVVHPAPGPAIRHPGDARRAAFVRWADGLTVSHVPALAAVDERPTAAAALDVG